MGTTDRIPPESFWRESEPGFGILPESNPGLPDFEDSVDPDPDLELLSLLESDPELPESEVDSVDPDLELEFLSLFESESELPDPEFSVLASAFFVEVGACSVIVEVVGNS